MPVIYVCVTGINTQIKHKLGICLNVEKSNPLIYCPWIEIKIKIKNRHRG